ncbi:MAG: OmpA family protein [candidate division Zixibacteria bacterium]|nr:OmpA family protein [candidate division Zixibacteria bacterium]
MKRLLTVTLVLVLAVGLIAGCASMKKRDKGALIGAGAGAALGAVIGKQAGNTAVGAIIGAAVGGAAGAYIGNYMDKQAEEMKRDLEGARIERVGEGIKITFDSGILFDVNKSNLRPEAVANLQKLAIILNKYEDTKILIEGHTDSTGSDEHNRDLSISRAQSVATTLSSDQVNATRFTIMGYGEAQPIADNGTAEGRQANRRVEIAIYANDKLKGVAKAQGQ